MISRSSADSNDTLMNKTRSDTASDLTDSDSRAHRVAAAEAEEAAEAEAEAEEAAEAQRLAQDRIERVSGSAPTFSVSGAALGGSHAASDATSSMSRCVPLTNPFSPYATPHLPCISPTLCLEQSRRHTRGQQLATCEAESRWQLCGRGIHIRSNCHLSSARGHGEGSSAGSDDSGSRWGGAAIGGSAGGWEPTLRLGFL